MSESSNPEPAPFLDRLVDGLRRGLHWFLDTLRTDDRQGIDPFEPPYRNYPY